jgi:hypothetical protein
MVGGTVCVFFGLAGTNLDAIRGDLVLDEDTMDSGTTIVVFDFDLKRSTKPVLAPGMSEVLT